MIERIGPVEAVAAISGVSATVQDRLHPETQTGGITVYAADRNLVATLRGSLAHGTF